MPKTPKATPAPRAAAKSAARNTDSGPSRVSRAGRGDLPAEKAAQTHDLVAAMPSNPNKAAEHGFDNGLQ
ncbi:MAG TPA: hypothetical protein VGF26_09865, partial [Ramlibacter sp.]